jgi:hypothetical protein
MLQVKARERKLLISADRGIFGYPQLSQDSEFTTVHQLP